jgi:hypothetical protein
MTTAAPARREPINEPSKLILQPPGHGYPEAHGRTSINAKIAPEAEIDPAAGRGDQDRRRRQWPCRSEIEPGRSQCKLIRDIRE